MPVIQLAVAYVIGKRGEGGPRSAFFVSLPVIESSHFSFLEETPKQSATVALSSPRLFSTLPPRPDQEDLALCEGIE